MVKKLLGAVIKAFLTSIILLLICAMAMYIGDFKDNVIGVMVVIIYFISNLIGGIDIGKRIEKNKYLWGIIVGLVYSICIITVSLIGKDGGSVVEASKLIMMFVSFIGGMIGGMLA